MTPVYHFFGRAGFATHAVAQHISFSSGSVINIGAEKKTYFIGGLRFYNTVRKRIGFFLAALQEGGWHRHTAIDHIRNHRKPLQGLYGKTMAERCRGR